MVNKNLGGCPFQIQYHTIGQPETIEKISGITFVPKNAAELYKECLKPENMADGELFLNVIVPENFQTANKKPVMVWLHGGGWTLGGAEEVRFSEKNTEISNFNSEGPGPALALHADVVVVAVSYRLNMLGFWGGNWGLWDQREGTSR